MAAAPWDAVGTRVDKYVIVKFIGQGGGGVVHEVESTDSRERFGVCSENVELTHSTHTQHARFRSYENDYRG